MSAAAKPTAISTADLRIEIGNRYQLPEWHLEHEVTLGGRRLDVVAFNLWGARRYRVVGFELKVSRGDWLRELADFQKSEEWTAVVDQFFVVAPGGVVRSDELPAGWGLLELRGSRMFTKAPAAIGTGHTIPREVAARFFTRLHRTLDELRRECDRKDRGVSIAESNRIREEIQAEWLEKGDERIRLLQERVDEYQALLRDLGVERSWSPPDIIRRAVRFLAQNPVDHKLSTLASEIKRSSEYQATVARQVSEFLSALGEPTT